MGVEETLVFTIRSEPGSKQGNSDHYDPAISYTIMIGRFESGLGIYIGEARAMRLNQHYVLETTKDLTFGREIPTDTRRFSRLSKLPVTDSKEEADNVLQEWVRDYVLSVCESTGLRTTLLRRSGGTGTGKGVGP